MSDRDFQQRAYGAGFGLAHGEFTDDTQVDTNTEPPHTTKFFSTNICDCVDDAGNEVDECLGTCWEWQRLDFDETIRDWWGQTETLWFGFSNLIVQMPDLTFTRDSGYGRIQFHDDLLDFMIHAGKDFSIRYEAPEPGAKEFHFWQDSPNEDGASDDYNWVPCKVFHCAYQWDDH